jgi:hypothetical protein
MNRSAPSAMPLPGAVRLRSLSPLTEGDGACPLICDLERGAVLEVPVEFQMHVAQALETGEPDEALLGWLVSAGLLTGDGGSDESGGVPKPRRGRVDVPGFPSRPLPVAGPGLAQRLFEEVLRRSNARRESRAGTRPGGRRRRSHLLN